MQRFNDFGIKVPEGWKYCTRCKYCLPIKAFYKKDYEDPNALCKEHKRELQSINRKLLDTSSKVETKGEN